MYITILFQLQVEKSAPSNSLVSSAYSSPNLHIIFLLTNFSTTNKQYLIMGTRGLLGLIIQAKRHAAYNHFDSYPAGLGQEIVDFILGLKPEDYAKLETNLREITV